MQKQGPQRAFIKFNGGRFALLCNKCRTIIRTDFDPAEIDETRRYFCDQHQPKEG